jgi:hypothetical protein
MPWAPGATIVPAGKLPVIAATGVATTTTVTVFVTLAPELFVTVKVKVVSAVRFPVPTAAPLVTAPMPRSMLAVPLLNTAVSVVPVPEVMGVLVTVKLVITGAAKGAAAGPPPPPHAKAKPSKRTVEKPDKSLRTDASEE